MKGVLGAWGDKDSKVGIDKGSFKLQAEYEGGDVENLNKKASKRDRLTSTLSYLHARGKFDVLWFSFSCYISHILP